MISPRRFLTAYFLFASALCAEDLKQAMARLNLRSALVLQSQAVDEHPVWSPTEDALAVNIEGKWMRVSLGDLKLAAGTWRGGLAIGVAQPPLPMSPIDEKVVRAWEKAGNYGPRRVESTDGTLAELKQEDLSTIFMITKRGSDPETLWKSGLENCHGLGLSPDEKYVAFVCELNGVIVTAL